MFSGFTLHQGVAAFFAFWIVVGAATILLANALSDLLNPRRVTQRVSQRRLRR